MGRKIDLIIRLIKEMPFLELIYNKNIIKIQKFSYILSFVLGFFLTFFLFHSILWLGIGFLYMSLFYIPSLKIDIALMKSQNLYFGNNVELKITFALIRYTVYYLLGFSIALLLV